METKKNFYQVVEEICAKDSRYKADAYELKRETHVSGGELLEGLRKYAIEQFGPMVQTVFKHWGVSSTVDFGNIVFNMVNKKILSKTDADSIEDFKNGYDFDKAFGNVLRDIPIKDIR
jgi:uncharacterized repeat protein (TIGR04138 family)